MLLRWCSMGCTIAFVPCSSGIGETNLGDWVRQTRIERGE